MYRSNHLSSTSLLAGTSSPFVMHIRISQVISFCNVYMPNLAVSAELEALRIIKADLTANKADWETGRAQQEEALQEARESLAAAASAAEADKMVISTQETTLAAAQLALEQGELPTAVSESYV